MITLTQLIPPELSPGRVVRLAETLTPEAGVKQLREAILPEVHYPGGDEVDVQYMGQRDQPVELTGHLRDQWNSAGFAAAARRSLEALMGDGFPIWLSWEGRWGRLIALQELEFTYGQEGEEYRMILKSLGLGEAAASIPSEGTPGAAARALASLDIAADELGALTLPEGL